MANGNPFYVQPGGDWGAGLSNLGESVIRASEMKRARDAKTNAAAKFAKIRQGASEAYESKDPEKMRKFAVANPEYSEALLKFAGVADDDQEELHWQELSKGLDDPETRMQAASTFPDRLEKYDKAMAIAETKDTRTPEIKNFEYAREQGYEGTFPQYQKGEAVGRWQPWGYGQMRNTETGELKDVQVPPKSGETIRMLPGGGMEIIRGEIGKKPLKFSEVQAKTGGFANRVEAANKILTGLEDTIGFDPASISEAIKGAVPGLGNIMSTEDRQVYNQAKGDFITAVLRLESGAAISPNEFEKEDKKYFPQPGDKPRVIANKRKARERQLRILKGASGGAYEAMKKPESEPSIPVEDWTKKSASEMTDEEINKLISGEI